LNRSIFVLCFVIAAQFVWGQAIGFQFQGKKTSLTLPFELYNSLIVIEVHVAGLLPSKFILDTGSEHSVLLKKEIGDLLGFEYDDKIVHLIGADADTLLRAHIARRVLLGFNGANATKDLLVFEDDILKLDELLGVQVHGILGADLFSGYTLDIDYAKKVLTIAIPTQNKTYNGFLSLDLEIIKYRPYVDLIIDTQHKKAIPLRLLIDTGADLALLLQIDSTLGVTLPDKGIPSQIGMGIGGQVEAYLGRCPALQLGQFTLKQVPTHYRNRTELQKSLGKTVSNGILGNISLSRFHVVFDFASNKLYLKPNKHWQQPFQLDKSGLQVLSGGVDQTIFYIAGVLYNGPAATANLQTGDQIIKINGIPAKMLTLQDINRRLSGKSGKKIKISFLRNGVKHKASFVLKDLI
jgi:PDZ domain/Aspartyl protease